MTDLNLPVGGRVLRAGSLEVELHAPALRYIRFNDQELARRVYPAIRDDSWGTVPAQITDLEVVESRDRFRVSFEATHLRGALAFSWRATIAGTADGHITYEMDGRAKRDFPYNRIGLCVLHPLEHAAAPCATTSGGVASHGQLPDQIAPQRWENGLIYPALGPFDELRLTIAPDIEVDFLFSGDEFEFEDQRNWADGSFKTYSTPLSQGWPHQAESGQRIRQIVDIKVVDKRPAMGPAGRRNALGHGAHAGRAGRATVLVDVGQAIGKMPPIGLQLAAEPADDGVDEVAGLGRLGLSHLRVDLYPELRPELPELASGVAQARALDVALEVAVHLPTGNVDAIEGLRNLDTDVGIARFILMRTGIDIGDGPLAAAFRLRLPGVPILGATAGNFAEVNRSRADLDGLDGLAFPMSPTVHDIDGLSVIEGIESVAEIVRTARAMIGGRTVAVSPLTIKQRWNLFSKTWTLDDATDPRITTTFAAGWLVGVLAELAYARTDSVTLFETIGRRGVRSSAGVPHPVFAVLAELAAHRDSNVLVCRSSEPLRVVALALQRSGASSAVVANLRAEPCRVRLQMPSPSGRVRVHRLTDMTSFGDPMAAGAFEVIELSVVDLGPFEVALLEEAGAGT